MEGESGGVVTARAAFISIDIDTRRRRFSGNGGDIDPPIAVVIFAVNTIQVVGPNWALSHRTGPT